MRNFHITGVALLKLLGVLLIGKIVAGVFLNYRDYLPPDFESDFLRGRDAYFWDGYHRAFFIHIISGPCSLLLGLVLISDSFRHRFPKWHRILGRIQGMVVLLLVAPSGLGMASRTLTGSIAATSFVILATLTALAVALGWRAAVKRRYESHRRWMERCFAFLCSAVIIRINGGLGEILGINGDWYYSLSAWTCWIIPLGFLELSRLCLRRPRSMLTPRVSTTRHD